MIQKTNYRLTNEALSVLRKDTDLCVVVAQELGVSLFTLPSMITRKSRRLTETNVASKIAEKMGKQANDIIESKVSTAA